MGLYLYANHRPANCSNRTSPTRLKTKCLRARTPEGIPHLMALLSSYQYITKDGGVNALRENQRAPLSVCATRFVAVPMPCFNQPGH